MFFCCCCFFKANRSNKEIKIYKLTVVKKIRTMKKIWFLEMTYNNPPSLWYNFTSHSPSQYFYRHISITFLLLHLIVSLLVALNFDAYNSLIPLLFFSQKRGAIPLITDKDITGFAPVHYAAKYGNLQVWI